MENPYASLFGATVQHGRVLAAFACVWIIDQEMKINNVAVHPRWRGRGIGSRLLKHLLEFGAQQGCLEATLEVRPSNQVEENLRSPWVPDRRTEAGLLQRHARGRPGHDLPAHPSHDVALKPCTLRSGVLD
jgi:GNAT superfamily N-acetyltransferase